MVRLYDHTATKVNSARSKVMAMLPCAEDVFSSTSG
jgi:hypothetical protein